MKTWLNYLGGVRSILLIAALMFAFFRMEYINDYRLGQAEASIEKLQTETSDLSKEIGDKLDALNVQLAGIAARQEILIDGIKGARQWVPPKFIQQ